MPEIKRFYERKNKALSPFGNFFFDQEFGLKKLAQCFSSFDPFPPWPPKAKVEALEWTHLIKTEP